ncbi:MAG: phosphate/phosphite/phosphonate ABC transporter substrate-binding protein [Myxococcales bacterium]|nr:phosphate/phosphite/phosphonate ABC transporter substrate-binding protein [Myxococcales bacterium]
MHHPLPAPFAALCVPCVVSVVSVLCALSTLACEPAAPARSGTLAVAATASEPRDDLDLRIAADAFPTGGRRLRFGITPYNAPGEIRQQFSKLAEHMSTTLRVPVEIVPAREYGDLIAQVEAGQVDLALFSPLSYVIARRRMPDLRLLARTLTYGAPAYSSFIIVRTRDPARQLADLRRRSFAYVDKLSTAGFLFPYDAFLSQGLDPRRDLGQLVEAGTHERAVELVASGQVDAAAVSSGALTKVRESKGGMAAIGAVRILHKAGRIPYDALCARPGLPAGVAAKVAAAFHRLNTRSHVGRVVLAATDGVNGWIPAVDGDYDAVRAVLQRVEPHLRPGELGFAPQPLPGAPTGP